jgi:hypothetical protein
MIALTRITAYGLLSGGEDGFFVRWSLPLTQEFIMSKTATATAPKSYSNLPQYCPTPSQIRAACLEIQREWSPEERAERRLGHGGFAQFHVQFLPDSEHPLYVPGRSEDLAHGRSRFYAANGR